ncbi:putative ABC transport system ATP-binding protein [Austwickia chelonae]|uniref:Putative ABC transporter permease/ATP-binding protein n=1 Tax=Austwickia chelonae NBRC 105200 TaxID=1184607 RepID=K6V950_9MICO|nr:ABC transporter ATP-binding protein [Austwickia chelonae]GAB78763.1 putative ABC transporter permease/ATP-binding protein [Austwickia chelonae NBRC 105200]SEW35293.1 putative ABC transport system ATP-binding protein [Austwickia chelonae]
MATSPRTTTGPGRGAPPHTTRCTPSCLEDTLTTAPQDRPGTPPAPHPAPPLDPAGLTDGPHLVRRLVRREHRRLLTTALAAALISGLTLIIPLAIGRAIDTGLVARDPAGATTWIAVILAAYLLRAGATLMRLIGDRGANRAGHDLRLAVLDRLLQPTGLAGGRRLPGDLLSVATTDVTTSTRGMTTLTSVPGQLVTVTGSLIVLSLLDLRLAAVVAIATPLLIALSVYGVRPLRPYTRRERAAEAAAVGSASDLTAGLRVVQGLEAESRARERFAHASRRALTATIAARRARGIFSSTIAVAVGLFVAALTITAAHLGLSGRLTVGEVVAVAGLAQTMGPPLRSLGVDTASVLSTAHASADRVVEVLTAPPARTYGSHPHAAGPPTLHLDAVTHPPLIPDPLTLDIPGEGLTALVAPGPYAEALADLCARRRDPATGTIRLGDIELGELTSDAHQAVLVAPPHRSDLFDGSILENIVLDRPPATAAEQARLDAVLRATTCDDVAAGQPSGWNTPVGEGGRSLSGGQRQRVALARALYADPPLLVLTHPTTSVDPATNARIAAHLPELRAGRGTLVVTTSPQLLAVADVVIRLDEDGRLRGRGRHAELLADEEYRKMLS